ncbi:hypothetical protein DFH27DRAFT_375733 [Peziza echinospora]|nr:hypothetical protein DFH27DRAFT_375733 [Peziza echinospora]
MPCLVRGLAIVSCQLATPLNSPSLGKSPSIHDGPTQAPQVTTPISGCPGASASGDSDDDEIGIPITNAVYNVSRKSGDIEMIGLLHHHVLTSNQSSSSNHPPEPEAIGILYRPSARHSRSANETVPQINVFQRWLAGPSASPWGCLVAQAILDSSPVPIRIPTLR